ncbi:Histidinol-phosphatase [Coccomyxa sp. Obi]|nr:Histidinol-phosphatase [Coccomyxa sp. Obi]
MMQCFNKTLPTAIRADNLASVCSRHPGASGRPIAGGAPGQELAKRSRPSRSRQQAFRMTVAACAAASDAQQQHLGVPADLVALAHRLADAAAEITTKYFRSPLEVESKSDASPVTEADRQAEEAMRVVLQEHAPTHAVFGEEGGMHAGEPEQDGSHSGYLWVLDPIDGTKSFITGKPVFGTLIALLKDGTPVLGVLDQPITKERWVGAAGQQTTLNGKPVRTRSCSDISVAYLYATTPHMFSGANETAFNRVRDNVRIPLYGCDCYAYGLLSAGFCDLVVEADMKPYDFLALVPIVEGAGGVMTDWEGQKLRWAVTPSHDYALASLPGEVIAAGDAQLHQQALQLLDWNQPDIADVGGKDVAYQTS